MENLVHDVNCLPSFRFSRTLSIWIDPNRTELIRVGGFDRLLVCLLGCSRHKIYVVELPSGWTMVSSRSAIDELADKYDGEYLSDDELDVTAP